MKPSMQQSYDLPNLRVAMDKSVSDNMNACIYFCLSTRCVQLGGAHGINEHEMDIKTWTQPLERLKPTMEGCYRTEAVISLLSSIMGQARENNSVDKQRWHTEYTVQLRDVSMKKLDQLTTRFIQVRNQDRINPMCTYI